MIFDELKAGRTVQRNPIHVYKSDLKSKKFIYLVAGLSGKEIEGIYLLQNLFEWLKYDHSMHDLPMIVIPVLNVDGYEEIMKENALGTDLLQNFLCEENKDSPMEISPETSFLMKTFKKYTPGAFINFGSGKPPRVEFCSRGKQLGNYLAKHNFYDLRNLEKTNKHYLAKHLAETYDCSFVNLKCPKISDELTLEDIWHHNEKTLKELIRSDVLLKNVKAPNKNFFSKLFP